MRPNRGNLLLRAVFALQRRRARRQGLRGGQFGAVSFIQFFGSALQVTPHFHSLVPDGVFVPQEDGMRFEALPPPTQGEVERLLRGGKKRGPARARARGCAASVPSALAAAAPALDGGGRPAPFPKAAPVRLPGGILPARQHAPSRERQAGTGAAMPLRGVARWRWSVCHERRTVASPIG
jgi:hypothetical protein